MYKGLTEYKQYEPASPWYSRVAAEIEQYRTRLGKVEAKRYKLDLLGRLARRTDEFSQICGQCQTYKQEITGLVQGMAMLVQMPDRRGLRKHLDAIKKITEHFKKVHKLVDKWYYLGVATSIGTGIGVVIGAALGAAMEDSSLSSPVGTVIGLVLGLAVGLYLDWRARKEGRVL
jgi:F0F1-type ATP synthase assembly protein I